MTGRNTKLTASIETYFDDLRRVRASGGSTGERSSYGPLANLLNAVGATLKPKMFCVGELADQGAGHPDFGLYAAKQVQKGRPREGQMPERGVVEVKTVEDDAWLTAAGDQVSRYWGRYRLVLVTNTRDFVLVGEDALGRPEKLETFRLARDAEEFARRLDKPRAFAREVGAALGEYLSRALSHRAALAEPKDLAWLLASYARDGLARVEAAGDAPSLKAVRSALEEALGVHFDGEKGARFFHSTLVQTLFYGVFSAWVLWARAGAKFDDAPLFADGYSATRFSWREAVWHLRAPVLRALFQQLSDPGRLQPLGLVEVLNWTAAALDRVDRPAFFARFNEGEAVPYFYEPFLEAFDPELRKQLGVWYTPAEVVRYMVARVDKALKDDLDILDGLAAENVYVLDPCCGTGAYLAEVLHRIAVNLEGQGLGALTGARVKQAATERVSGLHLEPVLSRPDSTLWNEYIDRYHYLGYKPLPGAQLRYFACSESRILALLGFGAAAWKTAPRDRFIGWRPSERERNLQLIVNNARFLILPWVESKNLASKLLAMAARQLPEDWHDRYAYRPVLLETFVDTGRFTGACYKAANWIHVGQTQGRGKLDRDRKADLPTKSIWLYPLSKHFRRSLRST